MKRYLTYATLLVIAAAQVALPARANELKDLQQALDAAKGGGAPSIAKLTALSEKGNGFAEAELGDIFLKGEGVAVDKEAALKWYQKAAVSKEIRQSVNDVTVDRQKKLSDRQKKLSDLENSADLSDKFEAALMYFHGAGAPRNDELAKKYIEETAEAGLAAAQNSLGYMYEHGVLVQKDSGKAAQWYSKAVEQKFAPAENNLGYLYFKGDGVPRNLVKSAQLFEAASVQGELNGISNLGWMYQHGLGVTKDPAKAAELYTRAAAHGLSCARYNLGYEYQCGVGVSRDYLKSARLYELANRDRSNAACLGYTSSADELRFMDVSGIYGSQQTTKHSGLHQGM